MILATKFNGIVILMRPPNSPPTPFVPVIGCGGQRTRVATDSKSSTKYNHPRDKTLPPICEYRNQIRPIRRHSTPGTGRDPCVTWIAT